MTPLCAPPPCLYPCLLLLQGKYYYQCVARPTLVAAASKAALQGVSITASWGSTKSKAGWPYPVTLTTDATGLASSTSKTLPAATGNGCSLTLTAVSLAGYTLDASSPTQGAARW